MNKKHEWANDLIVMDEWAVQNEIAEKVIELSGIDIVLPRIDQYCVESLVPTT